MQNVISNKDNLAEIDTNNSTLSIRITSDGLSFFITTHDKEIFRIETDDQTSAFNPNIPILENRFYKVSVINATHKALMIPQKLSDSSLNENYLKIAGVAKNEDETIIEIVHDDVSLIMAIDKKLKSDLDQKFNPDLIYTHPVIEALKELKDGANTLFTHIASAFAFLVFYNGGKLVYYDVLPCPDFASLLLYVNRTIVNNKAGKIKIVCSGDNSSENAENLKQYYKDVECNFNV